MKMCTGNKTRQLGVHGYRKGRKINIIDDFIQVELEVFHLEHPHFPTPDTLPHLTPNKKIPFLA
jgi:hypothetical protein